MIPKNIVFYFPYNRGAGGVNILFLKLATYLADKTTHNIYIVDYKDGYMVTHNTSKNVRELYLTSDGLLIIPEDSVIILQTTVLYRLPKNIKLHDDTKIIFWNLHPYNLLWCCAVDKTKPLYYRMGAVYIKKHVRKFLDILLKNNGIVFMDGENSKSAEIIMGRQIEKPVFLPVFSGNLKRHRFESANRFAWLGRLADFKISILVHTMERLSAYSATRRYKIIFYIIGDGPDRIYIEEAAKSYGNNYFEVIFVGEVANVQIEGFLAAKVSVLFAMGVSALDGARIGLPTVLLDFSYQPLCGDYKFKYIYKTENYILGRDIDDWAYEKGNQSLENMIDELRDSTRYKKVCDLCYQYYEMNHNIDFIVSRLFSVIKSCSLQYKKIKPFRRNVIMETYSALKYGSVSD